MCFLPFIVITVVVLFISSGILVDSYSFPIRRVGVQGTNYKYHYNQKHSSTLDENNMSLSSKIVNIRDPTVGSGIGTIGILGILINRLTVSVELVTDIQSRVDILGVLACSAVLLNSLSEQDITTRERDAVSLAGYAMKEPQIESAQNGGSNIDDNNNENKVAISSSIAVESMYRWVISTLLSSTPTKSVHIIKEQNIIGRGGVIGYGDDITKTSIPLSSMPILCESMKLGKETYLPDLQILPGKIEFTYLPINTQAVMILPFGFNNAVIVGTNKAKSFKIKDIQKIRTIVTILQKTIETSSLPTKVIQNQ